MPIAARRVPPDWTHPKDQRGRYIPLRDGSELVQRTREWDEAVAKWNEGLRYDYDTMQWMPIEGGSQGMTYAEYNGERPDPREYTPLWPLSRCTHWQMYEEVTEGTPISPVFASAEELARWMAEHDENASSYEDWLSIILGRPLRPVH